MKTVCLFLILTPFSLFAQDKNDTIKSTTKGDIICKIKTVSNGNIYYYIGDAYHFISLDNVNYYSGHGKVIHETKESTPFQYADNNGRYSELTGISKPNLLGAPSEKFVLYFNTYADSSKTKGMEMPYTYPIDALNYLATKGWHLVNIFSVPAGAGVEIRHYILERN